MNSMYLAMPAGLSELGKAAHAAIMKVIALRGLDPCGCKTFYSPVQWRERGEEYGCNSELIVVYDDGSVRGGFDAYYGDGRIEREIEYALRPLGLYPERATHWYSSIHKL